MGFWKKVEKKKSKKKIFGRNAEKFTYGFVQGV